MTIRTPAEPPSVARAHAQLAQAVRRAYRRPTRLVGLGAWVLLHDARDVHLGRLEVRGPHDVALCGRPPVPLHGWSVRQLCALVLQHWPGVAV